MVGALQRDSRGVLTPTPPPFSEHIDLGVKYDPATGIFGMDFYVVLSRAGYRVARRKHCAARVGPGHRVTREEAQQWFISKFEGMLSDTK